MPVEGTGARALRLGDVANVVEDHQPLIGDAVARGAPGIGTINGARVLADSGDAQDRHASAKARKNFALRTTFPPSMAGRCVT